MGELNGRHLLGIAQAGACSAKGTDSSGRRNALVQEFAMSVQKRRSDRSG
jgi:hypothetical protein